MRSMKIVVNFVLIVLSVVYLLIVLNFVPEGSKQLLAPYYDMVGMYPMLFSIINWVVWAYLSFVLMSIFEKKVSKLIAFWAAKTDTDWDDIIWDLISNLIGKWKYILSVYIWLKILQIPQGYEHIVDKLFLWSVVFLGLHLLTRVIIIVFTEKLMKSLGEKHELSKQLLPVLKDILIVFIWIIGSIFVLDTLWFNVWALITWAGIWWVAIAFAAQKTIWNLFGSVSIIFSRPFKIWDYIKVSWMTGTVKKVWLTYTEITDATGHVNFVPNWELIWMEIENFSTREFRRSDFVLWITYDMNKQTISKAVKMLEDILEKEQKTWDITKYRVNFDSYWDFSQNIKATFFSSLLDYKGFIKQKERINLVIKEQYEKEGIEFAFPTQSVIVTQNQVTPPTPLK